MGLWEKVFGGAGAFLALVSVALGAFGAHALRSRLDPRSLEVFETGVRYQTTHALALLLLALLLPRLHGALGAAAGWAFLAGIVVFSGSLYLLALTGVTRWGAVTPLGGVAFMAGWAFLLVALLRA
jgi:uncharacterized membrane protein YgdD (TMEM256/DUF423 family)